MDVIDELGANNHAVAASLPARHLDVRPARRLAHPSQRPRPAVALRWWFPRELQQATGVAPPFAIESFTDLDADVRQSVLCVRRSAFMLHSDQVRGFVYDVDTHRLSEIHVAEEG